MFKKFRSTHAPITISNTQGHSALIGRDFIQVHESLWKEAFMNGAVTEDMIGLNKEYILEKKEEAKTLEAQERGRIKEVMRVILEEPTKYLNKNNQLHYQKVVSLAKAVHKLEYFDSIWKEILAESK